MKTYVFLYDEVPLCEVMLALGICTGKDGIEVISETGQNIITAEGMQIPCYTKLSEIEMDSEDALVLCGGNVRNVKEMDVLNKFIAKAHEKGNIIGGICAGADIAAQALQCDYERTHTEVLMNRVVLSPGNDYEDFALEFSKTAGLCLDEADYLEAVRYFRNFQTGQSDIQKKEIAKVS